MAEAASGVSAAQVQAELTRTSAWLSRVEAQLQAIVVADNPFVTEAAQHVLAAGGKRLRPVLVRLAAQFGTGPIDDQSLDAAALVVELTHVASLYHDDVMDDAELRRGVASANARYGNSVAILTGDYLFSRASALVSKLGVDYVALQADTFARMVQGQIAELKGPGPGVDPMSHYLKVLDDKTGALIATSAVFGGMVAGLPQAELDALGRFGDALGLAFQLDDDLLDITSDTTGKRPGTDLRQGVATLPLLLLARSSDTADQALVAGIAAGLSDDDVADALATLRAHPVIEQAHGVIAGYAAQAKAELVNLPDCPAKSALATLVDNMTSRVRAV